MLVRDGHFTSSDDERGVKCALILILNAEAFHLKSEMKAFNMQFSYAPGEEDEPFVKRESDSAIRETKDSNIASLRLSAEKSGACFEVADLASNQLELADKHMWNYIKRGTKLEVMVTVMVANTNHLFHSSLDICGREVMKVIKLAKRLFGMLEACKEAEPGERQQRYSEFIDVYHKEYQTLLNHIFIRTNAASYTGAIEIGAEHMGIRDQYYLQYIVELALDIPNSNGKSLTRYFEDSIRAVYASYKMIDREIQDMIIEFLETNESIKTDDFRWQKHLARLWTDIFSGYKMVGEEASVGQEALQDEVVVEMLNVAQNYVDLSYRFSKENLQAADGQYPEHLDLVEELVTANNAILGDKNTMILRVISIASNLTKVRAAVKRSKLVEGDQKTQEIAEAKTAFEDATRTLGYLNSEYQNSSKYGQDVIEIFKSKAPSSLPWYLASLFADYYSKPEVDDSLYTQLLNAGYQIITAVHRAFNKTQTEYVTIGKTI